MLKHTYRPNGIIIYISIDAGTVNPDQNSVLFYAQMMQLPEQIKWCFFFFDCCSDVFGPYVGSLLHPKYKSYKLWKEKGLKNVPIGMRKLITIRRTKNNKKFTETAWSTFSHNKLSKSPRLPSTSSIFLHGKLFLEKGFFWKKVIKTIKKIISLLAATDGLILSRRQLLQHL